ncbi:MAG: carbohydrate porin [Waterburya sp.]
MNRKQSVKALWREALFLFLAGLFTFGTGQPGFAQSSEPLTEESSKTLREPDIRQEQIKSSPDSLMKKSNRNVRRSDDVPNLWEWNYQEKDTLYQSKFLKTDNEWSGQPRFVFSTQASEQQKYVNFKKTEVFTNLLELNPQEKGRIYEFELLKLNYDLLLQPHFAQSSPSSKKDQSRRNFGGPDAVPNRLESDQQKDALFELEFLKPYHEWKERIAEDSGFSFGLDYYPVILKSSDSLPGTEDYASSGVFRFTGSWQVLGRDSDTTGTLNFLVEQRHSYTDNTPSEFAFNNLGYIGAIEIPFADDGWHLTNLYWSQSWNNGNVEAVIGLLDVTDFVDVYPLTSPWTDFSNFVFSIGAATIDLPDDGALGMAVGAWLTDQLYIIGGFEDLNSNPNEPFNGFNTFFNDSQFFKHIEIGWTLSPRERYYLDNLHLTLWHADQREQIGVKDGWGMFFSFTGSVGDNFLLFARGGFSEDGGGLLQKAASLGFGYQPSEALPGSQLGFGVNWGQPSDALFGSDLRDQYAIESYFRLQITKEISITPDVQLLINPALNSQKDTIWVFGLRSHFAF